MRFGPRKTRPITTSTALMSSIAVPTLNGVSEEMRMEMPDVPPNAKLLGALKKCTPAARTARPKFKSRK